MSESKNNYIVTNNRQTCSVNHDSSTSKTPPSSLLVSKMDFHPALVVSSIRNHMSIVFEMEKDQNGPRAELLRNHDHSHLVLHHIFPSKEKTPLVDATDAEHELLTTIDSIAL
ncbi:uncharacterized protein LOC131619062 [Vicia villosa]|uniref:uncharacterized protein LOC131619062 n=1 Tax=Vicia villosa TaxID=3911 RepID=UPI00273C711D|nr:uncharacterized protein LOC131619062 [Vicia villosa]